MINTFLSHTPFIICDLQPISEILAPTHTLVIEIHEIQSAVA